MSRVFLVKFTVRFGFYVSYKLVSIWGQHYYLNIGQRYVIVSFLYQFML